MKYTVITGSVRQKSESSKVGRYIVERIPTLPAGATADLIDLSQEPIPVWDDAAWRADSDLAKQIKPYQDMLAQSDGYVVVTPEWAGMVPGHLKNFFLYTNQNHVGHKPALIVAVTSAERGGSYPVVELRQSSYKNNRLVYLPEHIIVRDVTNSLGEGEPQNPGDAYTRTRLDYALNLLGEYGTAMKTMRDQTKLNHAEYPFGM